MVVTETNMRGLFTSSKNLMRVGFVRRHLDTFTIRTDTRNQFTSKKESRVGFVTELLDISVVGPDTKRRAINSKYTTTLAHTDIDPPTTPSFVPPTASFHPASYAMNTSLRLWQKVLPALLNSNRFDFVT